MGNANTTGGGPRDRHKSGDSLPPSSPMGVKEGQAFSFDKRPSVGSQPVSSTPSHAQPITGSSNHAKIILQHSHEDDEPYFTQPKSVPTKHNFVSPVNTSIFFFYFLFFSFLFFIYSLLHVFFGICYFLFVLFFLAF